MFSNFIRQATGQTRCQKELDAKQKSSAREKQRSRKVSCQEKPNAKESQMLEKASCQEKPVPGKPDASKSQLSVKAGQK